MKKQLGIILFGWTIIGAAQAAEVASDRPLAPAAVPRISDRVLQLQALETARQKASFADQPIHTYGIIRDLNTNPISLGLETSEDERTIVARSVMINALSHQNTFPDMVVFHLCRDNHLATRMAYVAISAWAYDLQNPVYRGLSNPITDEMLISRFAYYFSTHWIERNWREGDRERLLLPLFKEQLLRFHDLCVATYPEVSTRMREKKEEVGIAPSSHLSSLPTFFQDIHQAIEANLGHINQVNKESKRRIKRTDGAQDRFSNANEVLGSLKLRHLSYENVVDGAFDAYTQALKYGLSIPQAYDLVGVFFLQNRANTSGYVYLEAEKQRDVLSNLRWAVEREGYSGHIKTTVIDPLCLKAIPIEIWPFYKWGTEKKSFVALYETNSWLLNSSAITQLFDNDPAGKENLIFVRNAMRRYKVDLKAELMGWGSYDLMGWNPYIVIGQELATVISEGKRGT